MNCAGDIYRSPTADPAAMPRRPGVGTDLLEALSQVRIARKLLSDLADRVTGPIKEASPDVQREPRSITDAASDLRQELNLLHNQICVLTEAL